MYDENTFAAAYRSDLRDKIVETLKDYADGITPTKQWCWDQYDDVEIPVTGNDNGSWTCNASKSSENMQNIIFSDDWDGLSLAITRTTRPWTIPKSLRFSTVLGCFPKSLTTRFPNCLQSKELEDLK